MLFPTVAQEEYFSRGGKVTFPHFSRREICFLLVEIFDVGTPQTNFSGLKKWKTNKQTNKGKSEKRSYAHFYILLPLRFLISHLPFHNFPSFFFFPYFLCLYFLGRSAKISRWKTSGSTLPPPPPRLLRHWLPIQLHPQGSTGCSIIWMLNKNPYFSQHVSF